MPPMKPPTTMLHELDTKAYVDQLGQVRRSTIRLEEQLRRGSIHRAAMAAFVKEIDELARLITGDERYVHGRT